MSVNRDWITNVAAASAAFRELSPNKACSVACDNPSTGVDIADKLVALIQFLDTNNRYLEEIQTSIRL
jgi:hypothetical protein